MWFFHLRRLFCAALAALCITAIPFGTSLAQEENLPIVSQVTIDPETSSVGYDGISFDDPFNPSFRVPGAPLDILAPNQQNELDPAFRGVDLRYTTPDFRSIEMSFAARSGYGFTNQGELNTQYQSRMFRIGRNLERQNFAEPAWYFFIADEDEALIWDPGVNSAFNTRDSRFALQDQVELGDMQIGVAYDWNGWQTSLSYVEREVGAQVGHTSYYQDESFVGLTVTYRHQAP